LAAAAHNLLRMSKLIPIPAQAERGYVSLLAAEMAKRDKHQPNNPPSSR
jgi:hypothetical protein